MNKIKVITFAFFTIWAGVASAKWNSSYRVYNNSKHINMKVEYKRDAADDEYFQCRDTAVAFVSNAKVDNHYVTLRHACEITKVTAVDENGNEKFTVTYPEVEFGSKLQRACEQNTGIDSQG